MNKMNIERTENRAVLSYHDGQKVAEISKDPETRQGTLTKFYDFSDSDFDGEYDPLVDWFEDELHKLTEHSEHILACGFCGKTQREVHKLIAGPTTYICDECVALCHEIVQEEATRGTEGETIG